MGGGRKPPWYGTCMGVPIYLWANTRKLGKQRERMRDRERRRTRRGSRSQGKKQNAEADPCMRDANKSGSVMSGSIKTLTKTLKKQTARTLIGRITPALCVVPVMTMMTTSVPRFLMGKLFLLPGEEKYISGTFVEIGCDVRVGTEGLRYPRRRISS